MKKFFLRTIIICLTPVILTACSAKDANESSTNDMNEEGNNEGTTEEATEEQLTIEELSKRLIDAIGERDMEIVAEYVHPEKGVLFSPYVYVMDEAVVLEKEEVALMMDSDENYVWGTYDGKGSPIDLTPTAYLDEFMNMTPFSQPDDILINDLQDRGNTLNNVREIFPEAEVIEYYTEGSEEYVGMDWSSILLVYEEDDSGSLQLIALIRDMWTI